MFINVLREPDASIFREEVSFTLKMEEAGPTEMCANVCDCSLSHPRKRELAVIF
jgi:hypothetical protein